MEPVGAEWEHDGNAVSPSLAGARRCLGSAHQAAAVERVFPSFEIWKSDFTSVGKMQQIALRTGLA